MEKAVKINFNEQEKLFIERTGNNFQFYYDKYLPKLIYYIQKLCNDQPRAEDLATESFLIAFNKIEKYEKDKAQFSTWLFTIARNLTLQDIKNDNKTISMDVTVDEDGTTMKDFIQDDISDDILLDEMWQKKASIMKKHIDQLKEPFKTVIVMRELNGMAYKDIASKLGKNLSTIKSQIRNGRLKLISETEKEFDVLEEMYA